MNNEVGKSAHHALAHGTARTRAAHGEDSGKDGGHEERDGGAHGEKKIASMEIKPSKNGGHVITHRYHPSQGTDSPQMPQEDETYTAQNIQDLHNHIDQHLGGAGEEQQEPDAEAMLEGKAGGEGGAEGASQA